MNKTRKIIGILLLLFLALPSTVFASIELRYVDAWQAYNANTTFYNKTVAQLIYDESNQHNINPRLILTLLQRESSSISQTTPSSTTRAAWPLFYMYDERMANCLNGDESKCNDLNWPLGTGSTDYRQRAYDFGGVGQQIAYAIAQLRNLHDNSIYCGGSLAVSVDGSTITTDNAGSCALYKYTPHEDSYKPNPNGTDGFYNIFNNWFSTPPTSTYSKTNIISEDNFIYQAMSVDEINNFLLTHGVGGQPSWLANYIIPEYISVAYPGIYVPPAPTRKPGDGNGDNVVDSTDLSILADQWGKSVSTNTGADFNGDGVVDSTDLSILADAWGK